MPLLKNKHYTYADYCTWDDGGRWELISGEAYAMSPAPSLYHQEIAGEIYWQLASFLRDKSCKAFIAPVDVRLNADDEDDIVCQPDVLVVCDHSKLDEKGCKGAPDLVVEVLSPATARHDQIVKLRLYRNAGVKEYWIVNPDTKIVQTYTLDHGQYFIREYTDEELAPVGVLDGCVINLEDVFRE